MNDPHVSYDHLHTQPEPLCMSGRVYIANFGRGNWAWPDCLKRNTIAVVDDARVHQYWLDNDRDGYIERAKNVLRLASGGQVIKPVASRWFNLNTILMETVGDLWIHREKNELWWAVSIASVPEFAIIDDPQPIAGPSKIYVYHRAISAWSNRNKDRAPLRWDGLHPRAKEFLFSEGTFQQLSDDNAAYARSLAEGASLAPWHERPEWQDKAQRAKRSAVTHFDSRGKTIARMALTAMDTAAQSGDVSVAVKKDKKCLFRSRFELEDYLKELLAEQGDLCALTGLQMVFDDEGGDSELRCSLDRICSNGHYERGNLQIVCRFANRWKGSSDNDAFVVLIERLRT
jgi:hypothetical protein